MKTSTKAKVIRFIKDHGEEGAFEWRATINGIKVGLCKTTIILYDEGYKFPPFNEVNLYDGGELEFVSASRNRIRRMSFFTEDRSNDIVDKYFKVMEGILNNA